MAGLILGSLIFVYTIQSFGGFAKLFSNLKELKYFYLFVLGNSFLWMLLYTQAWRFLITDVKNKVRYLSLLKIKMTGEGVNFMTPLGFMAGDPVRVLLLKKYVSPEARLRSVVIDRLMHTLSAQVFCLSGILLIFTQDIAFPIALHIGILALYSALCVFFVVLIITMITGRGFGVFEGVFKILKVSQRFPRLDSTLNDLRLSLEYYKNKSWAPFILAFFCHLSGRFLGAVEIMIVFYCYEGHADFIFSMILVSLSSLVSITMGWIPGALGALEYVYAQFFMLYGFSSDVGVSVQIVRRLRVFFWIGMGILLLDYAEIGRFFERFKKKPGS
ncbi:MAG: flippase-like domain-containing protein [Deltaproteobacteria bacterium]|nr:flippase-like domain-containing protein [Deltaproteobacteria bacterium]